MWFLWLMARREWCKQNPYKFLRLSQREWVNVNGFSLSFLFVRCSGPGPYLAPINLVLVLGSRFCSFKVALSSPALQNVLPNVGYDDMRTKRKLGAKKRLLVRERIFSNRLVGLAVVGSDWVGLCLWAMFVVWLLLLLLLSAILPSLRLRFFLSFCVTTNWQWHECQEIFNLNKRAARRCKGRVTGREEGAEWRRHSTKTFAGLLCGFLLFLFVDFPLLPQHLLPLSLYCSRCIVWFMKRRPSAN